MKNVIMVPSAWLLNIQDRNNYPIQIRSFQYYLQGLSLTELSFNYCI